MIVGESGTGTGLISKDGPLLGWARERAAVRCDSIRSIRQRQMIMPINVCRLQNANQCRCQINIGAKCQMGEMGVETPVKPCDVLCYPPRPSVARQLKMMELVCLVLRLRLVPGARAHARVAEQSSAEQRYDGYANMQCNRDATVSRWRACVGSKLQVESGCLSFCRLCFASPLIRAACTSKYREAKVWRRARHRKTEAL